MKVFLVFISLIYTGAIFSQEKFSPELLKNPNKYGKQIEQSFNIIEVEEFSLDSTKKQFALKNGLRSSTYVHPETWTDFNEDIEIKTIKIVFSKYPIRKNGYQMNHALLFNRLKNLFDIDPSLNDTLYNWEIVLQTNCKNDLQVDSLFHGVIIEYETTSNENITIETNPSNSIAIPNANSVVEVLNTIESFSDLPEEVLLDIKGRKPIEKTEILISYFEELLKDTATSEPTPEFLENHHHLIKRFLKQYGNNTNDLVYKIFDRNPQWKNALVVADWTGSMYQHGAQALLWHTLNFERSGLEYFTLFNDGDSKGTKAKKIGETGGVYYEKADKIDKVIQLYQLVMLKGGGGDGPENDLEAILKAQEKYPAHSEIILIADNNACVRDFDLLELIDEPVRVIICGYNDKSGINPQYVEIARKTGGSLHTIDIDIHNIQVELNKSGEIESILDYALKVGLDPCYFQESMYPDSYYKDKVYTNLDKAKKDKEYVRNIDLSSNSLIKPPRELKRFKRLETLNLSKNNISKINTSIYNLYPVQNLDLSENNISKIPYRIERMRKLKRLNLANNKIDTLYYNSLSGLKYLIYLNLSDNQLNYLPVNLNFRHLEILYLDNNNLEELPVSIGRLRKIKELSLNNNALTEINKKIGYLKKLEFLDLSNNDLSELPIAITKLKKLKRLVLSGNNFSKSYIEKIEELLPNTIVENQ